MPCAQSVNLIVVVVQQEEDDVIVLRGSAAACSRIWPSLSWKTRTAPTSHPRATTDVSSVELRHFRHAVAGHERAAHACRPESPLTAGLCRTTNRLAQYVFSTRYVINFRRRSLGVDAVESRTTRSRFEMRIWLSYTRGPGGGCRFCRTTPTTCQRLSPTPIANTKIPILFGGGASYRAADGRVLMHPGFHVQRYRMQADEAASPGGPYLRGGASRRPAGERGGGQHASSNSGPRDVRGTVAPTTPESGNNDSADQVMEEEDFDMNVHATDSEHEDDDEFAELISGMHSLKVKIENGRKKHCKQSSDLQEAIRQEACKLMGVTRQHQGRRTIWSQLPAPPALWEGEEPDPENLTMAWTMTATHPYNRAAANIIAHSVLNNQQYQHLLILPPRYNADGRQLSPRSKRPKLVPLEMILNQMLVSYRRFQEVWKQQQNERLLATAPATQRSAYEAERNNYRLGHNADSRRIGYVGRGSQSSDEEDEEEETGRDREKKYYIIPKPWRAPDLIEFFHLLDSMALAIKKNGTCKENEFVFRQRLPPRTPGIVSARRPTPKLERQFYSQDTVRKFGPHHIFPVATLDLVEALKQARDTLASIPKPT
ncbi:hypothetical protein BKA62DRAFT_667326 [Auriculariales sp. MPI-PUGE-AT-0066]|nr:hypothetical protein BKA62DRAFT_667326 [Auriculariales sp. MPI-PUGE-AT-0066]